MFPSLNAEGGNTLLHIQVILHLGGQLFAWNEELQVLLPQQYITPEHCQRQNTEIKVNFQMTTFSFSIFSLKNWQNFLAYVFVYFLFFCFLSAFLSCFS